jgi:ParB-like chromosome segregation protein Spo0J
MIGFEQQMISLKLEQIIPLKRLTLNIQYTDKFRQIAASIREVGIIEPPVVAPMKEDKQRYMLLDGHLRMEILKMLGTEEVTCLISKDDESYTYNKHLNRLSTIQEHRMIMQAIDRGVAEEKIAAALNVNIGSIRNKLNLLQGICAEAADILKDKHVAAGVFPILRKMKAVRQIEAATFMEDASNYTVSYAEALFGATPRDQLVDPSKPKKVKGLDSEQMARMEAEMASLEREYALLDENYGADVLNLTMAKTYLSSLLTNGRVVGYLAKNHPDFLAEFQQITDMKSLNIKSAPA